MFLKRYLEGYISINCKIRLKNLFHMLLNKHRGQSLILESHRNVFALNSSHFYFLLFLEENLPIAL